VPEFAGHKFSDLNNNGREDPGEPYLGGWEITLTDNSGNTFTVGTLNNSLDPDYGTWQFPSDLPEGYYEVAEVQVEGWIQTYPDTNGGVYGIWYNTDGTYSLLTAPPTDFHGLDFGNYPEEAPPGFPWGLPWWLFWVCPIGIVVVLIVLWIVWRRRRAAGAAPEDVSFM
jgi:hypothetical protein